MTLKAQWNLVLRLLVDNGIASRHGQSALCLPVWERWF